MKRLTSLVLFFCTHCFTVTLFAQINTIPSKVRCATSEYYQELFKKDFNFKLKFEQNQRALSRNNQTARQQGGSLLKDTITVAVHIVTDSATQSLVTDAVVQSQLDVLNEAYRGLNPDSVRIPAAFRPVFGKSNLVFLLAKTNPYGEPTNGISRIITNTTYNVTTADNAKSTALGGADAWDPKQYLNIWVVDFGMTGILGISVFPGDPRPLSVHGFVCDYHAFGRGASYLDTAYNRGKTTTHELGHFFNLYHVFGNDPGVCTYTDFPGDSLIDDTPKQANPTYGNPDPNGIGVVVTDDCSPNPPGIMYQNYMDYTDDVDMAMFTKGQQVRMENTLTISPDRMLLLNSTAYRPPALVYVRDARIRKIITPSDSSTQCAVINPKVMVRNSGTQTLTTVQIIAVLDNNTPVMMNWSGHINSYTETQIALSAMSATVGHHTLTIYTKNPNGSTDENPANDTAIVYFTVPPVLALTANSSIVEGFDAATFPPANWQVINPDNDMTWERNATVGNKAPGSAWFNDWNNPTNYRHDDLVMPDYSINNIDSVFLQFNLAAASYSDPNTTTVPIDTLSILISKDCGNSFTTVYQKWGNALITTPGDSGYTVEFFPNALLWRTDSVNLGAYLNNTESQFQVFFRFSGNYENNIFIDDVNLRTVVVPALLKQQGYLILPVPFHDQFSIWHYQQPTNLKYITIYNAIGQLVWKRAFSGDAGKIIAVNLQLQPAGVYIVNMGYSDHRNISQRIIKR